MVPVDGSVTMEEHFRPSAAACNILKTDYCGNCFK